MAMDLDKIVPFGRSFDEYQRMFSLSEADLAGRILGVGDGPASFNAEASAHGRSVISIDPIYAFDGESIRQRFYAVVDNIIEQVRASPDDWVWDYHRSPEHLRQSRIDTFERFYRDYSAGKQSGRYCAGELPVLNFPDQGFELLLCSHLLFLYSAQLSYEFHLASVREMLRVAAQVRIFPLLDLMRSASPYVSPLIETLNSQGFTAELVRVDYEMQKGGNTMLVIQGRR